MWTVAHHLVRRGVNLLEDQDSYQQALVLQLPKWGAVMIGLTVVLFFLFDLAIRYTYAEVVATLTTVETPIATAIICTSPISDEPHTPLLNGLKSQKTQLLEQELFLVKAKPITAKLHTTISHLRARAGFLSRFRGFHVGALNFILFNLIANGILSFLPQTVLYNSLANIFTSTLLCRLNATWTHVVISDPSEKYWNKRVPDRSAFSKLAGPTLLCSLAEHIAILVPVYMFIICGLQKYIADPSKFAELTPEARLSVWTEVFVIAITALTSVVGIFIPARAALRRVQASLLPEDDEAIVPFDRTFGGKVVPEILGGSGRISMLEAWRSFDKDACFRLYSVYIKVAAMHVALFMLCIVVITGELRIILGDEFDKVVIAAAAAGRRGN